MSSGGFSFNFLSTDHEKSGGSGGGGEDTSSIKAGDEKQFPSTKTASCAASKKKEDSCCPERTDYEQPSRRPFAWIQNVQALLADRAQEEIVYTEISLLQDQHDDNCSSFVALRCVDLTQSSYGKRKEDEEQEEEEEVWKHTDIQTGVYEGGRKVWECSLDLVHYMVQENTVKRLLEEHSSSSSSGKNDFVALELGCGHGLPGCFLLREALQQQQQQKQTDDKRRSNTTVVFTDYNDSVVTDATLSNIVLNTAITTSQNDAKDVAQHVVLGAGDWLEMSQQLLHHPQESDNDDDNTTCKVLPNDGMFDLILAAETLYTETAARETALLLHRHLRPATGVALIATKRYYFGVGGGVDALLCAIADKNSKNDTDDERDRRQLQIETVRVHDNGSGNIREVLKVWKPS